jgi:serine/threonine protein kinase/Tol biopolymer transport system component
VVARRLRDKLAEYYRVDGADDPIRIKLPKGSYVLIFEACEEAPSPKEADVRPQSTSPTGSPSPEIDEADLVGTTVSHYEILELLGRGGTGIVYRAEDLRLRRGVALKFLAPEFSGNPDRLERFRREARTASAVNHPGVCAIYDVGEHQGRAFFVMELVEGPTLDQFVGNKPLPLETVFDLGIQIADALATAHAQGVFHRDVRPGNIIVNGRRQAKLLDFSAAESVREYAAAPQGAPQISVAAHPRIRADVHGLGSILHEMAAGRRPSGVDTPSPASINPGVPADLAELIQSAANSDPRIRNVVEIRDELARLRRTWELRQSAGSDRRPRPWMVVSIAVPIALVFAAVIGWLLLPVGPPKILKYTQLTHDGMGKLEPFSNGTDGTLVTDGSRIYFSAVSGTRIVISEVSTAGGETVPLQQETPLVVKDISPDRSEILITDFYRPSPDLPLKVLSLPGGNVRPLANFVAHDGTWAPDGQKFAYAKGNDLFVAASDGSSERKLASLPGLAFWLRWSPDGARLRFSVKDIDGATSLWEAPAAGPAAHRLFPGPREFGDECCGSWSPDGQHFIFQSTRLGKSAIWDVPESGVRFGTPARPVQLTEGPLSITTPVFSRDGRQILAIGTQRRGELARYQADTGQFNIYLSGISADHVDFSRDGQWIAYASYPESVIWRSRVDGNHRMQLSPPGMVAWFPRWSPGGEKIAYMATAQGKPVKIYVVSSAGGAPEQVLPSDENQVDPNWSPDGSSLMFAVQSAGPGEQAGAMRIEMLDLKTHWASRLPGGEGLSAPRWSPDGRYVVATALSQDKWRDPGVVIFDFKTGQWTGFERDPIDNKWWSADGKYFYFDKYANNDPAIFRIRLRDRRQERVADLGQIRRAPGIMGWWMGIAPDSSPLVLRDTSIQEIYALDWRPR